MPAYTEKGILQKKGFSWQNKKEKAVLALRRDMTQVNSVKDEVRVRYEARRWGWLESRQITISLDLARARRTSAAQLPLGRTRCSAPNYSVRRCACSNPNLTSDHATNAVSAELLHQLTMHVKPAPLHIASCQCGEDPARRGAPRVRQSKSARAYPELGRAPHLTPTTTVRRSRPVAPLSRRSAPYSERKRGEQHTPAARCERPPRMRRRSACSQSQSVN